MKLAALCMLLLALLPAPVLAAAADDAGCTDAAHVRWDVDIDQSTVEGASVDVPGCADGDLVGLQLIMEDGDLPSEPLVAAVEDEKAVFDLTPYAPGIAPTIGVRVTLHPSEGVAGDERIEVTVERRYFNPAGNEQRALREIERLSLDVGSAYVVAGPPDGYRVTDCSAVGVSEDVVGEGVGTFIATESGRHLACYRMTPGAPASPPDETAALDDTVTRPGVVAPGSPSVVSGAPTDAVLARTGASVAVMLVLGMLMLGLGWRLTQTRRH